MFWDALFKFTKQKLDHITDIEKLLFIEKGMRGGVSMISTRKSTANNEFCPNYVKNILKK